ncbi:MAG: outer membrane lipoprotein-sorting protein [Nitrospirota bacterium]
MLRQVLFIVGVGILVLKPEIGFGFGTPTLIKELSQTYATLFKTQNLSIDIGLNQGTFSVNNKLVANAGIKNGQEAVNAEVKSWIELPATDLISIINLSSFAIPANASVTTKIMEYTFIGSEPEGKYNFGGRFLNPISGEHISTDIQPFLVDFPKVSAGKSLIDYQTFTGKIPNTTVDVILNKDIFIKGDELIAKVHVKNGTQSNKVEIKIWVELPGASLISLFNIPEYSIPANADFEVEVFKYKFSGNEPQGTYKFGTRFLQPTSGDYISTDIEPFNFLIDTTPPQAIISSPTFNSYLSGTIAILGTATDTNFKEYSVSYGTGNSPSAWNIIATSTTKVENGTLATWQTTNIEDGTYTLRLVTKDKLNQTATATVTIKLDNTLPLAIITFPTNNLKYKGTLTIIGTAFDVHLAEYKVQYGKGESPATLTTIATSSTAIVNGTLATWNTLAIEEGTYTIRLEVNDKAKNIAQTEILFINADLTAEDILQKVADNFNKIEDIMATITTTGSIGTETYPETNGTLLMKKPDKVKIITPSKDETIIINGEKMYVITQGEVEEVDIKEISDISPSSLDFYYYLDEFKDMHEIVIKDHQDNIYILEATPKIPQFRYEKMILYIDYSTGLDVKKEVFYENTPNPQLTTEIEEYQLINNIYIPTKLVEKIVFEDAVVESISTYTNIQLNTGIPDSEFEP